MNKRILIVLCFLSALLFSCSENEQHKPKLNEDQFIHLLIDIHLADGTLSAENIYRAGKNYRPSYYYNSIYKKYGIQAAEFDSCVAYYANNPDRFTQIYDKVIDSLNHLETKYRIDIKNAKLEQDTINLWKKRDHWIVPRHGRPYFDFNIKVKTKGIYTITADIRFGKKDQTENPTMEAYFWKKDTSKIGQKAWFEPSKIAKDTLFRTYTIQMEYPDSTYTELRGNLMKWDKTFDHFTQDFEIKNIKIYNPEIRPDTAMVEKEIERHLNRESLLRPR